jgi:hypothetical protein
VVGDPHAAVAFSRTESDRRRRLATALEVHIGDSLIMVSTIGVTPILGVDMIILSRRTLLTGTALALTSAAPADNGTGWS